MGFVFSREAQNQARAVYQTPPGYDRYVYNARIVPKQNVTPRGSESVKVNKRLCVAAIDFGTAYSGYAFSFHHEFESDPLKIRCYNWKHSNGMSNKTSTSALFDENMELVSFGYEAETEYNNLVISDLADDYYFFTRFKMKLFESQDLSVSMKLKDRNRQLEKPAIEVFSKAIRYLKDHLVENIKSKDTRSRFTEDMVYWVLTVPAIWNDKAKQFMREAAVKAGIASEKLTLALEPEAAAILCKRIQADVSQDNASPLPPSTKYMVVDLGGGTIDVTIHEISQDGTLEEIDVASGGNWGGTTVDDKFFNLLTRIFGGNGLQGAMDESPNDIQEFYQEFEIKKRNFKPAQNNKVALKLPAVLRSTLEEQTGMTLEEYMDNSPNNNHVEFKRDKMLISGQMFHSFFDESKTNIINHLSELLYNKFPNQITVMMLVGGYSESLVIQQAIEDEFSDVRIIKPEDASLAVLKGAVLFGHEPQAITSRICKYTYGIAIHVPFKYGVHPKDKLRSVGGEQICDDVFDIHLICGQKVSIGMLHQPKRYSVPRGQSMGSLDVYASRDKDPKFVTEGSCVRLGSLIIELDHEAGHSEYVLVKMTYEGTEISVEATEEKSGKSTKAHFDFVR